MEATGDVILESGILDQIQSLVIDASQVVSYKWLSRKFSVSSNAAKRILQEFATQNEGNKVEVVYAISGWSRCEPRTYNIQLVPKFKLQGAKREFHGTTCQHVYSVQPRLLNNPAQLLSAEHVQAWELFMQPADIGNCLRDNRFGSVSCSHVRRGVGGSKSVIDQHKAEPSSSAPLSMINMANPTTPRSKAHPTVQSSSIGEKEAVGKNVLGGAAVKEGSSAKKPTSASAPVKARRKNVVMGRKKPGVTGGGPSLANLWDKALAKVKGSAPHVARARSALVAGDADVGIRALGGDGGEWSGDEEWADFAPIRCLQASNTEGWEQRVVVDDDFSANEDVVDSQDAISLASPRPFKKKTWTRTAGHQIVTNVESVRPTGMEIDEEKRPVSGPRPNGVASTLEKSSNPVESSGSRVERVAQGECTRAKQPTGAGRRKGLKPRINERYKGGVDVAWETDEVEEVPKGDPTLGADKIFPPPVASKAHIERPPTLAKVPRKATTRSLGKAGGKASPNGMGAGQGSLLSFFKKED